MAKKLKKVAKKVIKKKVKRKAKKNSDAGLPKPLKSNRDYEVDHALRTLMDAEAIKNDASMMKDVEKLKGKKINALKKVKLK